MLLPLHGGDLDHYREELAKLLHISDTQLGLRPDPLRRAAGAVHQCVPVEYRPLSFDEHPSR